ncbi:MAG: hypothetical protein ACOY95_03340 [Pseudomonadota bacterium]
MAGRTTLTVTLGITRGRRWPYWKTRVLGPRSGAQPGELQIPLEMDIDTRLLQQRSGTVKVKLDADDVAGQIKGSVING